MTAVSEVTRSPTSIKATLVSQFATRVQELAMVFPKPVQESTLRRRSL